MRELRMYSIRLMSDGEGCVWGKESLTDAAWHSPTNADDRFFKVSVEMP